MQGAGWDTAATTPRDSPELNDGLSIFGFGLTVI
jgi:hypothetical protein